MPPLRPAPLSAPFNESVHAVVAVESKVGVPAKEIALLTPKVPLVRSVVPEAIDTEPTPRGPLVMVLLFWVLEAPTTTPPPETVRPLKVLAPLSWRIPAPDLVIEAPALRMLAATVREGAMVVRVVPPI